MKFFVCTLILSNLIVYVTVNRMNYVVLLAQLKQFWHVLIHVAEFSRFVSTTVQKYEKGMFGLILIMGYW